MKMLILAGNVFLGRAVAETALKDGHEVTAFTRGISGCAPEGVAEVRGDRTMPGGMDALRRGDWDAVVDVARSPRQVLAAAEVLGGRASRYVFVSTTSVYADLVTGPLTTQTEVVPAATDADEGVPNRYPNLKVRCEQIVRTKFPDNHLIVRPGLIVGPGDPTDRFTYWVDRTHRAGPILAPGRPGRRVRFTDVRDLASWIVSSAVAGFNGTFNAVGPSERVTMAELLDACLDAAGCRHHEDIRWIPDGFLLDNSVEPYTELPLWVPELPDLEMFAEADSRPAQQHGLCFRPISETINDTRQWSSEDDQRIRQNGLDPDRERQLLDLWRCHED
ncbi:MAG: hypothetical protein GY926_25505 [bacterium]|nr:hypothetical protein [bacterium]